MIGMLCILLWTFESFPQKRTARGESCFLHLKRSYPIHHRILSWLKSSRCRWTFWKEQSVVQRYKNDITIKLLKQFISYDVHVFITPTPFYHCSFERKPYKLRGESAKFVFPPTPLGLPVRSMDLYIALQIWAKFMVTHNPSPLQPNRNHAYQNHFCSEKSSGKQFWHFTCS